MVPLTPQTSFTEAQSRTAADTRRIGAEFLRQARRGPRVTAVHDFRGRMSRLRLAAVALSLIPLLGLEEDEERVGVVLPPGQGGALVNLALALDGRTAVNLNHTTGAAQLARMCQLSGIRSIVSSRLYLERIGEPHLPGRLLLAEDLVPRLDKKRVLWNMARVLVLPSDWLDKARPQQPFTIIFSSGTTGDPKGVVHYHRYPISYDSLIRHWHDYRDDDVCACPAEVGWLLPVATTFLYSMRAGITAVLYHQVDGRFDPAAWRRLIAKHQITNFVGTPTIYRMLVADPAAHAESLASLRHGVSAGEPLPPDTISSVRKVLGFAPLDGIGMSECMVYCFNRRGDDVLPGSCGRPAPGCDIRLVDEDLCDVPDGQEGVLVVRRDTHPGMMREYWNKPEQTAEIFRGPWYYSGDVLVRDAAGRYWFQGRADDVINASGYRISPFEVESCLVEHPSVLEAAAVESPDALRGMVVKAFVVLRGGRTPCTALAEELQHWVKDRLAPYKYPRRVEFLAALPKTTSGKIRRRELRDAERQKYQTVHLAKSKGAKSKGAPRHDAPHASGGPAVGRGLVSSPSKPPRT